MKDAALEIERGCERQVANAHYNATTLHMWLRDPRSWKRLYLVGQLVAGAGAALAAEFTRLRDRFRQARNIRSARGREQFESAFAKPMDTMDAALRTSLTPPERYFRKAQAEIEKGGYAHSLDQAEGNSAF
jgi:hypothetical protein